MWNAPTDCKNSFLFLVVLKHVVEGLAELIGNLLHLQLLAVDLVLDVVDPLVQLRDVHLAVLIPGHKC